MLINYSISGSLLIHGESIKSNYIVRNITTGFISEERTSEMGYYNINLANFPNNTFDKDDIIVIHFYTRYNGIDYESNIYNIINPAIDTKVINSILISSWRYTSLINSEVIGYTATIRFMTSVYKQILFKLYIQHNGVYKEIDSALIDKQILNLTFNNGGHFKIVGYVVRDNELLTYSEKEFDIISDTTYEGNTVYKNRYIEWE